jgi:peroxiredoxin family protein
MDTENVKVRQLMVDTFTDGTKELSFDLVKNKKQRVTIEGCDYEIELMNIGKENIQGQIFPVFEFNVSKV